jgi:WD40 repeat protein
MTSNLNRNGEALMVCKESTIEIYPNLKKDSTLFKNFNIEKGYKTCFSSRKNCLYFHEPSSCEICLLDCTTLNILNKYKVEQTPLIINSMIEDNEGRLFFSTQKNEDSSKLVDIWNFDLKFENLEQYDTLLEIDDFFITENFMILIESSMLTIHILDLKTKKLKSKIQIKSEFLLRDKKIKISENEKYLLIQSNDHYVTLIDLENEIRSQVVTDECILHYNISNSHFCHETFKDNLYYVNIYNIKTQKLEKILKFHEKNEFHFLDDKKLVCVNEEGKVKIIEMSPRLIIDFLRNRNHSCDINFNYHK